MKECILMHENEEVLIFACHNTSYKIKKVINKELIPVGMKDGNIKNFLSSRVLPRERHDKEDILSTLNIETYNLWDLLLITNGQRMEDYYWIKISDEDTYENISLRFKIESEGKRERNEKQEK